MSKYGIILLCICSLDISVTVLGIKLGVCEENNTLLNWFLFRFGLVGIIFAKFVIFTAIPIAIMEIAPRFNKALQQRIATYYKFTIFAYILIFSTMVYYFNFLY
jgi:hypothetical protein